MKKFRYILLAALCLGLITGCGSKEDEPEAGSEKTEDLSEIDTSKVAGSGEMSEPEEVARDGMVPVPGSSLADGTYEVSVDSSSSMFQVTGCELTVKEGEMTAVMTMGGTGYLYVYMGTGEEASKVSKEELVPFSENEDGTHSFKVPVEALDQELSCAAFSKKKEKWYDRLLVFRADSLPQEAYKQGAAATVESLGIADGQYTVEVELSGGSGRASVQSPAALRVEGGKAYAMIVFSSPNYDYMKVGEKQYEPVNTEGNSAFEIPVDGFDCPISVLADTTAMSTPHEIEYTLRFDSATVRQAQE